jgi:hypothetical protein
MDVIIRSELGPDDGEVCYSETLVSIRQATRCHSLENHNMKRDRDGLYRIRIVKRRVLAVSESILRIRCSFD